MFFIIIIFGRLSFTLHNDVRTDCFYMLKGGDCEVELCVYIRAGFCDMTNSSVQN